MPMSISSLLDFQDFSVEDLNDLFAQAFSLLTQNSDKNSNKNKIKFNEHTLSSVSAGNRSGKVTDNRTVALLFFEASTRTRFSFEMAAWRAGFYPTVFEAGAKTSLEKGESIQDTILNIAAMDPLALIIRCGDGVDLSAMQKLTGLPLINAGWGVKGHPTQALLDMFTLQGRWGNDFRGKKLLFVGDVRFSRVVSSHLELAKKLGYEVAQCGPESFHRDIEIENDSVGNANGYQLKKFSKLSEALAWADAVMALRFQFERHEGNQALAKNEYVDNFSLSRESLKNLSPKAWIMHPGPINQGLEMQSEVLQDPRCLVLDQVRHGVYLRQALFSWLGIGEKMGAN